MNESEEENYSKINAISDEAYIVIRSSKKEVKQRKELVEILKESGISEDDYYNLIKSGSRKRRLTE
ncbi:MAG: hypothetical protein WBL93_14770 [Lutisporaceae bacterium]